MLLVAHRMPRTAAGCVALVDAGADLFEWDVQLDSRGAVVVSHYLPLLGVRGWFEHDNAAVRWRKGRGARRDLQLDTALELLPPGAGVLLDPKESDPRRRARLADALTTDLADDRGRFRVSTDDDADLARYRAAGFSTWRTAKTAWQLTAALRAGAGADEGMSVRHTLLDAGRVAALHAAVPTIVAWTVNDPGRAEALRNLGVDGVTTDEVSVMRRVRGG